ncbi:MAG: cyclase family protein [Nitrospinota bacterium]|nr:MAG: cyclase family protein [Nitrospinota bacterium]
MTAERSFRIIDLSVPLRNHAFESAPAEITYFTHRDTARRWARIWGIDPDVLPDGLGAANERIQLTPHSGTHVDSPYHYTPVSAGKPARTIDQVPLEWCYGDGVVLDMTHKKAGEGISAAEVQAALHKIGYTLKPFDIVLIRTDTDKRYDKPDYMEAQPGMTREATLWLLDQGIKVIGIDAWGLDRPFSVMVQDLKAGHVTAFWEAHYVGREREYLQIEKLANLDQLPYPFGFKVACFPVKIERASGGWCRAVAIIEGATSPA